MQIMQTDLMTSFVLLKRKERERGKNLYQERNPETATQRKFGKIMFVSHKHHNSNSNAIGNNENLFQQTRITLEKKHVIGIY